MKDSPLHSSRLGSGRISPSNQGEGNPSSTSWSTMRGTGAAPPCAAPGVPPDAFASGPDSIARNAACID